MKSWKKLGFEVLQKIFGHNLLAVEDESVRLSSRISSLHGPVYYSVDADIPGLGTIMWHDGFYVYAPKLGLIECKLSQRSSKTLLDYMSRLAEVPTHIILKLHCLSPSGISKKFVAIGFTTEEKQIITQSRAKIKKQS